MYTYTKIKKRVRAYVIRSVADGLAITERGDRIVLSTAKAKAGDFIIVEIDIDGNTRNVERWVEKTKFQSEYRRD